MASLNPLKLKPGQVSRQPRRAPGTRVRANARARTGTPRCARPEAAVRARAAPGCMIKCVAPAWSAVREGGASSLGSCRPRSPQQACCRFNASAPTYRPGHSSTPPTSAPTSSCWRLMPRCWTRSWLEGGPRGLCVRAASPPLAWLRGLGARAVEPAVACAAPEMGATQRCNRTPLATRLPCAFQSGHQGARGGRRRHVHQQQDVRAEVRGDHQLAAAGAASGGEGAACVRE